MPRKLDLMVMIGGRMVRVLDATLRTIRLETVGGVAPGDIRITLYPIGGDGRVETEAGVEAVARVIDQNDKASHLAFIVSTYPLSKLIISSLAHRQGIEPYHRKIGL
ncbi:hypothetical protein [Telmatospirillum siberiense]|uniref:hypothetical protein n=1 Tax=Telmatospirillum siberiense TaxID=382514 RepID=UPI0011AF4A58|nr:hypothetical protein [Telmatospirillum siberiense]